ncbi:DUF5658 family protein [Acidimangrovimonas pyrenivorans]|uniref:DUF5658 family protein n=1 Tax=Acidimangrovimonas pyrenivorans TaxID=2030798 RepID=A0ABV7AK30_9RHOB
MTTIDFLALAVIALQIGDMTSTLGALRRGGREVNPLLAWLMRRIGVVPALIAAKGLGTALAVWLWLLGGETELWLLAALYLWVVLHNMRVGRRRS